jgi:hypothetical protein
LRRGGHEGRGRGHDALQLAAFRAYDQDSRGGTNESLAQTLSMRIN